MKYLLILTFFSSFSFAQTEGANSLKTIGSMVGVDLKSLDSVMISPSRISCEDEDANERLRRMVKESVIAGEVQPVLMSQEDENKDKGDVRVQAKKYGGRGGLGVRLNVSDRSSISVGAGPKNVGVSGKIKLP